MNNIRRLIKSFGHASRGLKYVIKNEQNFQIEVLIGFFIVFLMFIFSIKNAEKVVLFLVIFAVLVIELINTIFERVVDILKPRIHPYAQLIKDIMAAAVLLSAIGSVIIGILIFYPYFKELV